MQKVDMIIKSRGDWLTLAQEQPGPRCGAAMDELTVKQNQAIAITEDRITAIGPVTDILESYGSESVLDWGDHLVMPGLIDPHTHPIFLATRENEFQMRNLGKSYVEIALAGGGIRSSVRSLRQASEDELTELALKRADGFLALGTTTIEAKSGYGLSTEDEIKSLRAIRRTNENHALDLEPTFLGAHEIPDEYREDRNAYIDLIIQEMIPAVAKENLARFCDVFCEAHVFTVEESRRILNAAKQHGMQIRIHADEIESTGGAELAAEVGALSADHLGAISPQGIEDMRDAKVVATLLPGTSFFLNLACRAPGRKMIDSGVAVALATDFNPGSCHTQSLFMIMTIACIHYGITAAEAITAVTVNAAYTLGLDQDRGQLKAGMRADIIGVDAPNAAFLPYKFGDNPVRAVVKNGKLLSPRSASCS